MPKNQEIGCFRTRGPNKRGRGCSNLYPYAQLSKTNEAFLRKMESAKHPDLDTKQPCVQIGIFFNTNFVTYIQLQQAKPRSRHSSTSRGICVAVLSCHQTINFQSRDIASRSFLKVSYDSCEPEFPIKLGYMFLIKS